MVKKKSFFCKHLYHRKCKRREVGGQKKPNLVNVVCERPLGALFHLISQNMTADRLSDCPPFYTNLRTVMSRAVESK